MNRARGFSLLELLVVLAILALAVTLVVLQPGLVGGQRALQAQAARVLAPMQRICEEAVLTGRPWGVWVGEQNWRVLTWMNGQWQWPAGAEDQGSLPTQPEFQLSVDGHPVLPQVWSEREAPVPQLLCLPQGLRSPVELNWIGTQGEPLLHIRIEADGKTVWDWPA